MKERPILFSGEMVKAILDGRKTQTRRVVKTLLMPTAPGAEYAFHETKDGMWEVGYDYLDGTGQFLRYIKCPYGQPGDRLWVRETFHQHYLGGIMGGKPCYQADQTCKNDGPVIRWHPSIHMPRWASRITLEVVNIRVERVQDISYKDARAEGMALDYSGSYDFVPGQYGGYQANFRRLWESLNAKRGYSWESNPWVWVVEFKKVEP